MVEVCAVISSVPDGGLEQSVSKSSTKQSDMALSLHGNRITPISLRISPEEVAIEPL